MAKQLVNDLPATRGDLAQLKADLTDEITSVKTNVKALNGDVKTLKGDVSFLGGKVANLEVNFTSLRNELTAFREETNKRFDLVMNHIDGLAKLVKEAIEQFSLHKLTHQRDKEQLENHEGRLSRLESAIFPQA
ncbi:hypothetical protein FJZ40_00920 [Candidatus Shapirobacteria bacterium]|nr:hypothetical protein [Candidatus Shapirobacteria bacterium]